MRWCFLLVLGLNGCAGAKVVVGLDYLFRNSTTKAESQFWPSATASVDQGDEYVARLEVHVPLGHQEVRIVNAHEIKSDPAYVPLAPPTQPIVIGGDSGGDTPPIKVDAAIDLPGGVKVGHGTDPWLVASASLLVLAVGWVAIRTLRLKIGSQQKKS